MEIVEPQVFLVAETKANPSGMLAYLKHVDAPNWDSDAGSDVEMLPEFFGRMCYRSWKPGLNPNVTKVREGNQEYLANILKSGHGSVLEHSWVSFVFADVSRVFTHELVRHRVGVAISQESLRYVRLDDLSVWLPTVVKESGPITQIYCKTIMQLEELQKALAEEYQIDNPDMKFNKKKEITSAMRRVAPIGLATSIGWSADIRTIRHVLEMRTSPHAEEEIRLVFGKVGMMMLDKYPNLFADYKIELINGHPCFTTEQGKV